MEVVSKLSDHLSGGVLFWDLACPSVTCDDRGSKITGRTHLLCPRESSNHLLFTSSHNGVGIDGLFSFSLTGC